MGVMAFWELDNNNIQRFSFFPPSILAIYFFQIHIDDSVMQREL